MKNVCKTYYLFAFFFSLLSKDSGALIFFQNKNIDSLQTLIKSDKLDTNKVIHSYKLCWEYTNIGLYDTAIFYGNSASQLALQLNFKKGLADSYGNIAIAYKERGDYLQALDCFNKALKIDEELNNKNGITRNLGNIGLVYRNQGDYLKALDYYFRALKMDEELGKKNDIAADLSNIGVVYRNQGDYPKALDYYFKALKLVKSESAAPADDKKKTASILSNIGVVYGNQADYPKALDYFFKALEMDEELGRKNYIARHLGNFGNVYKEQGDYPKALDYFFRALKIAEQIGDKSGTARHLAGIGSSYTKTGKFKEAEQYFKRAISIDDSIGVLNDLRQFEEAISLMYDAEGDYKDALNHYKKAITLKDTLFSQENKKQLVRKEMNFEFEKKEAITKANNEKQQAVAEEKSHKQKIIIWSVVCGLLLVVVFAGFVFRSLRITRRQKNIIEVQKNEVSKQKDIADSQRIIAEELREISEKQKHIVEEKQKEIVDSITYARRIQRALLTSDEYIKNNLAAEYFILFKPKDIVSGDFYWALRTQPSSGEPGSGLFYMATADCTGHGVPGAFMSMLNISYFNENVIERGIRMPHDILNVQRTEIIKALNPPGSTEVSRDGMDCILCVYDFDKMLLHFALANNPLWLVRNGKLIEFKPDKMPVGKYIEDAQPFNLQTINLQKGDIIYTFTDGYADQFGGPNGKKFKYKQLEELLLSNYHLPMKEQQFILEKTINAWKGYLEQVDDILVIGVKV